MRNYIFLYAIEYKLPLPIGSQSAEFLDTARKDEDETDLSLLFETETETDDSRNRDFDFLNLENSAFNYKARASEIYKRYKTELKNRFK